ncbi:MAG: ankyrin repeat domain-containing protein [bacterium]
MKKLFVTLICLVVAIASCSDKDAMQKKMEETAERNKKIKEEIEAKKKEKPKFVDDAAEEEMPPLVEAATKGKMDVVKAELGKGTLVDIKDGRKRTALYQAASEGKMEIVSLLLSEGANVNTKRDDGDSPLMAAARKGNLELVKLLIEKGADVKAADNFGRTALMMAATSGSKELFDFVLKDSDLNARDKYELSSLIFAMRAGHMDLAKYILGKGAQVWKPKPVKYSKQPITLKIEGKVQPGMDKVIEELDKKDVYLRQKTELFYAIEKGDLELVKLLVAKGSPVLVTDVEQSRENIIYVYGANKEEERDMLFEREIIRTNYDRDQKNLLHYAAEGGYVEIMKFLIAKGARLEETDGENVRGPLFYAVGQDLDKKDLEKEKRLAETVGYIIEEGKKTWTKRIRLSKKELDKMRKENQSKPWWEQNPFDVEWKEVTAPKVDIEEYDYEGWTALTLAAKYGQFESLKVLLEKNANINHKERKMGNTALIYSQIGKYAEMEKYLLERCAKEGINFDHEELEKQGWKCVDGKEVFEKPAQ